MEETQTSHCPWVHAEALAEARLPVSTETVIKSKFAERPIKEKIEESGSMWDVENDGFSREKKESEREYAKVKCQKINEKWLGVQSKIEIPA